MGVFASWLGLHPARDVDAHGVQVGDRLGDVLGPQAARDQHATGVDDALGESPVEHLARTRARPVDQQPVRPERVEPGHGAVACGEGPDGERHALGHPSGVLGALVPVELHGAEPDLVRHLDDACGRLVTEHADGQHLVGQALHDVGHRRDRDLPRGGGEDEADGIGPEPDRQEGVRLGGDAADLDEDLPFFGAVQRPAPACAPRREATGAPSSARTASAGSPARTRCSPTSTAS